MTVTYSISKYNKSLVSCFLITYIWNNYIENVNIILYKIKKSNSYHRPYTSLLIFTIFIEYISQNIDIFKKEKTRNNPKKLLTWSLVK
jgi:hypothetical protein